MELEEVQLIENPQTPIVNPPVIEETDEDFEVEEQMEEDESVEENPKGGVVAKTWKKATGFFESLTGGVSIIQIGVGAVGIVAATVIPKVVKFNTGWKDLIVTTLTAALGGFILGKVNRPVAVAFVIGAGGVLFLKFVKWAMAGFKDVPLLLDDYKSAGQQPVLSDEFEFEGFDEGPIYNIAENGIYDLGQEPEIHPTAGGVDDLF